MARTTTKGLEYTSLDVDFFADRKVMRLQRKVDANAPLVYIALLCVIYKEGYYVQFDDDLVCDVANATRLNEDYVGTVVRACIDVGLLSREMYDEHKVLTSVGIQKRYTAVCEKSRKKCQVKEYSLLNPASEDKVKSDDLCATEENKCTIIDDCRASEGDKCTIIGDSCARKEDKYAKKAINAAFIPQSKVKKSKENYSFSSSSFPSQSEVQSEEKPPKEKQQEEFLLYMFFKNWATPNEELRKFVAYNRTGGRNWDRMSFTERQAALLLWKQEPAREHFKNAAFLGFWRAIYDKLSEQLNAPHEILLDALSDDVGFDVNKSGNMVLFVSGRLKDFIERYIEELKPVIRDFQSRQGYGPNLSYRLTLPTEGDSPW